MRILLKVILVLFLHAHLILKFLKNTYNTRISMCEFDAVFAFDSY